MTRSFHEKFQTHWRAIYILTPLNFRSSVFSRKNSNSFARNLYLNAIQLPFPFQFYGNSTSAILEGVATISLLPRGEEYVMTLPYAHCKGILMGTMTMELGGKVSIECAKTGYAADLEFKLRVRIFLE